MQGVAQSYSLWLMIGANVMALGAVLLAWRVGRQLTENGTAALIAFAFLIGTPLIYYSTTARSIRTTPARLCVPVSSIC